MGESRKPATHEYQVGDWVEVDIMAGITPEVHGAPDWKPGIIEERRPNGMYLVRLRDPLAGRGAEKEARPEHIRPRR